MMINYYVVKAGEHQKLYTDPVKALQALADLKGAEVEIFQTEQEAQQVLNAFKNISPAAPDTSNKKDHRSASGCIDAYVDGSFDKVQKKYSYGIVFVNGDKVIQTLTKSGNNEKYLASHQIAGEVFGALAAMKWAIDQGFQSIRLHYDYMGIEQWATGAWRANRPVSIDYVTYFHKLAAQITVEFIKVKAHSGDRFNEMADQLAKEALK